jgi:hypothetical protein
MTVVDVACCFKRLGPPINLALRRGSKSPRCFAHQSIDRDRRLTIGLLRSITESSLAMDDDPVITVVLCRLKVPPV